MKDLFKYILLTLFFSGSTLASSLDEFILQAMQQHHVHVVGYSIIKNYQVVAENTLSTNQQLAVSPQTIFQAADISQTTTAFALCKLNEIEKFSIDASALNYLQSYILPTPKNYPVIGVGIKRLLSMTAGISVVKFYGYIAGHALPTLIQLLNGESPANNKPVVLLYAPGEAFRYSSGGYELIEQALLDHFKLDFPEIMNRVVLRPLKMQHSIFASDLPSSFAKFATPGYSSNGQQLPGKWLRYRALAATGLWSTPHDLANLVIDIMRAYHGMPNTFISQKTAEMMLTQQPNTPYALGVLIDGRWKNLNFRKTGSNIGYYSVIIGFPKAGVGLAIMTNSGSSAKLTTEIIDHIAKIYNWPSFHPFTGDYTT